MPVINGEKWACSSCIKGHRVSGCIHNDRELHHINPKGRPVKQCEHCRGARKSKSHHAKCDCGDKKDKLKEKGDAKGMTTIDVAAHDNSDDNLAHGDGCQCHSGGKCLCGTKKDGLELRLDTGRQTLHEARAKPKLTATHSESHLTVFANGHHKPCHRNNNSAHVSGLPYKIPRPHTLHGQTAFAALVQANNNHSKPEVPTTRSMDTLSLSNTDFHAMFGSTQSSADSLPMTTAGTSLDTLVFQDNLFTGQNNTFGRDDESPSSNVSDSFSTQQWPWTTNTVTPVNGTFAYGSLSTSPSQDCLPQLDNDWAAISSAGFNQLWSAGDLPLDPSKFSDSLAQPISHSGESKLSGPGLTVASSVHSETGEPNFFGDLDMKASQSAASETLFWEDSPVYRLNTSAPTESIEAPASMPNTIAMPSYQNLESTFAKTMTAAPASLTSTVPTEFAETAAISMPTSFDDLSSIDPWSLSQNVDSFGGLDNFGLPVYPPPGNWF